MHKALLVALAIALVSCGDNAGDQLKKENVFRSAPEALLSRYNNISFDTLKVFSAEEIESQQFKYKGRALDSIDMTLLPKEFTKQPNSSSGFFACYKFYIDSRHIGLITRTPSYYVSSSVKLFVFDTEKGSIVNTVELAEEWGDAGDYASKTAWLIRNKDKKWQSFIRVHEGHSNSVENEKDTTTSTFDYYYLLQMAGNSIDTVSKDSGYLVKKFRGLLK